MPSDLLLLTSELRYLAYTALLSLLLWIPYILAEIRTRGLSRAVSYPTGFYDDLPDWAQRCHRAHMNLVENLVPFAALVLIAQVAGVASDLAALGVQLFFWAEAETRRRNLQDRRDSRSGSGRDISACPAMWRSRAAAIRSKPASS